MNLNTYNINYSLKSANKHFYLLLIYADWKIGEIIYIRSDS